MARLALLGAAALVAVRAAQLPALHATSSTVEEVKRSARWWAHVGDKIVFAPPASLLELSQDESNYYYALGSASALSHEQQALRVGGEGRWHIFHLPEGSSMLQVESSGDRRATLSSLIQLRHGDKLSDQFPEYMTNATYVFPGSPQVQEAEKQGAAKITAALFKDYLTKLTSLPGPVITRSWENPTASKAAQDFLQREFTAMGLTTCLHRFQAKGKDLINVVAYLPGTSDETLTVGAHYDSRPFEGAAPGAEDNGSGVAMLLAVAKAYMESKFKPVKNVYFVGFAAEEPGLIGSKFYAQALAGGQLPEKCTQPPSFLQVHQRMLKSLRKHSAIVLDEVGWKSPNLDKATINLESRDWTFEVMDHLAQANKAINGAKLRVVHNGNPFGSDHMSFLDNNLQGVLVINGDDEKYPHYHQSTDTMDSVDSEYASDVGRMVFGGLVRVGGLQL